jgi:hypothetical protein
MPVDNAEGGLSRESIDGDRDEVFRRLYADLAEDASPARLPAPVALRVRADRRARIRTAIVCTAVAAVFGGVALATSERGPASAPLPATTIYTSAPAVVRPGPPIPDSAFFVPPADTTGGRSVPVPTDGPAYQLSLCRAMFPSDALIDRRRGRSLSYFDSIATAQDNPQWIIGDTITVYRAAGAVAAMTDLRAALSACPRDSRDGATLSYRLPTPKPYGDDRILIEETWNAPPDSTQPPYATLFSVVRVGDVVTVLQVAGWDGSNAAADIADSFTGLAVSAIVSWHR